MVRHKFRQALLVLCLFLFVLVVLGGGLHLSSGAALLAAATGTPLIIYVFNRWSSTRVAQQSSTDSEAFPALHRSLK